jgi:hypothetical protein
MMSAYRKCTLEGNFSLVWVKDFLDNAELLEKKSAPKDNFSLFRSKIFMIMLNCLRRNLPQKTIFPCLGQRFLDNAGLPGKKFTPEDNIPLFRSNIILII